MQYMHNYLTGYFRVKQFSFMAFLNVNNLSSFIADSGSSSCGLARHVMGFAGKICSHISLVKQHGITYSRIRPTNTFPMLFCVRFYTSKAATEM